MPTVTVAIMMPIPEALDYVFRKQVSFFNKDNGMQLRGQVNNNVSFYVLPISAVYSGWQTLNFWILKIEEGKLNSLSIKVMKFILLVINGKYREKEIASSLLFVHTEISSMESIARSFVIFLENAIANVIVKLIVKSNCIMLPNDVYPWSENEEISPYPTMWNSLINKFAQQGMCVEVLKYFRSMRLVVHICSRILMSWFKACVDPLVWPNGKEMNGSSLRFLVDRNRLLSTALIELLRQFLNNVMGTLEGMKIGFAFRMKLLHAIILNRPWNPGALNFPIAPTICIYFWSDLLILHGLLNFVFDRGKVNGSKFQP
jgi:pentatricopeptide repeat protein